MIREAIAKLIEKKNLKPKEMEEVFTEIMSGKAEPAQIGAFLTALRIKGETVQEITAAAKVMRNFATKIDVRAVLDETVIDTCGTGGSGANTFNISTAVAFVLAGCGLKVAKHGNRSASSACGSADVLEALGINLNLAPEKIQECAKKTGICFMFAPLFHGAMKYAGPVRKAIGIRTIFNILGPLSNPASATHQILGVYDPALTEKMAKVLANLGIKRAFIVCGKDSLDEISITGPTKISELKNKKVKTYKVTPAQFGFEKTALKGLRGGNAQENAKILTAVLKGEKGPRQDVVLLNAAFGLIAAEKAKTVKEAIKLAQASIDSGAAFKKLEQLKVFTNNQ